MLVKGFYDGRKSPSLTIRLSGVTTHAAKPEGLEVHAVLDTDSEILLTEEDVQWVEGFAK